MTSISDRRKGVSLWLPATSPSLIPSHSRSSCSTVCSAVAASGCNVTIAKEGGAAVPAGSILSIMGLGVQQGDTVQITVEGDNAETVADSLTETLLAAE